MCEGGGGKTLQHEGCVCVRGGGRHSNMKGVAGGGGLL